MNIKRYQIRALGDLRDLLAARNEATSWTFVASTMQSAWQKFVRQRFGVLKPDPSLYDISLVRP